MAEQAVQVYQEVRGFDVEQLAALADPLQERNIKQRKGGWDKEKGENKVLSYIKGDYAIATANRIFGFGKWGYRVTSRTHEVCKDEKKGEIEYYTADVELLVAGSMFPFPGDGVGIVTAPYTVEMHEKARKEAVTDALKRALRHYGDQFGLSLYNEDNYVEAEDGSEKRVGDVGKKVASQTQQQTKRVVDSTPAPQHQAQTNSHNALTLEAVQKRAVETGIRSRKDWQFFNAETLGEFVPDEKLKNDQKRLKTLDEAITKKAESKGTGR